MILLTVRQTNGNENIPSPFGGGNERFTAVINADGGHANYKLSKILYVILQLCSLRGVDGYFGVALVLFERLLESPEPASRWLHVGVYYVELDVQRSPLIYLGCLLLHYQSKAKTLRFLQGSISRLWRRVARHWPISDLMAFSCTKLWSYRPLKSTIS